MVLTSSACFWFSTSSSLILWSFKLLRPKIFQSWPCFLTNSTKHRIVDPKKVFKLLKPKICQSWPCFLTHGVQHRILNPRKVFKTPETKNLSVPTMFFFLTNSAQHRIVNSKKVFQTPEDQNLFDFDPAKSGNVTSLEPLARFSSPPFLKRIF